jgi:hypothetical protein
MHGDNAVAFPIRNAGLDNVTAAFTFHNYLPYVDNKGRDHVYSYGTPHNMSGYCFQAQLAQYMQFKNLFEGFQRHMWTYYTAMLFWKSQSPWPSFRGFFYDSWLQPTGG